MKKHINDNNIVPGLKLGPFLLTDSITYIEEKIRNYDVDYSVEKIGRNETLYKSKFIKIWIVGNQIKQIGLFKDDSIMIDGQIGIGNSLNDINKYFNTKFEYNPPHEYTWTSKDVEGICIDIEDYPDEINTIEEFDNFNELNLKIEAIYIY